MFEVETEKKDDIFLQKSDVGRGIVKVRDFSPYADNGGTVVAIAGSDFAVIASETRLAAGYSIYTRYQPKLFNITSKTVLGCTGCWCDALTLVKTIKTRVKNYMYEHNRTISSGATAQLLSTLLYHKRFFPYYVYNIIAGLDEQGRGVVFSYDPVGSYESLSQSSCGSASMLIQPMLDNRVDFENIQNVDKTVKLTKEECVNLIKDTFISAAERDIYCGDYCTIQIITASGIEQLQFDLRKD